MTDIGHVMKGQRARHNKHRRNRSSSLFEKKSKQILWQAVANAMIDEVLLRVERVSHDKHQKGWDIGYHGTSKVGLFFMGIAYQEHTNT